MIFSLLVPTRERLPQFIRFLKSVKDTVSDLTNIEILVACDEEDIGSIKNVKNCKENLYPDLNIHLHIRKRSIYLNRDYYNWLAGFAKGDFIWVLGDDLVLMEKNWDITIATTLEGYLKTRKDRIICASIKDNTPKPNSTLPKFPCFPLFTKESLEIFGFLLHPEVPTWGADYLIYVLYNSIERLIRIENVVYLNHISYHTRQIESDAVSKRIGSIFNRLKMKPENNIQTLEKTIIPRQIKFIKNYICNYKDNG